MNAKERRGGRRPPSHQMQTISRALVIESFARYGWTVENISEDYGEDVLVRIFEGGNPTGLDFYAQLKATEEPERYLLASGTFSYPIETLLLAQWLRFPMPVLLILCDISGNACYWVDAQKFVEDVLERENPGWRRKTTVQVHIPITNILNDEGIAKIRDLVARRYLPSITARHSREPFVISARFTFPPTLEGQAAVAGLRRHIASGEPVEIDGQFIEALELPQWWTDLMGPVEPGKGRMIIGPASSQAPIPTRFDMITNDGDLCSIPYLDLCVVQAGEEQAILANQHQPYPLQLTLRLTKEGHRLQASLAFDIAQLNVEEVREFLHLQQALAAGGRFRLTRRDTREVFVEGTIVEQDVAPDPVWLRLVDDLAFIQQRTGHFLTVPESGLTLEDIRDVNEMVSILRFGRVVSRFDSATISTTKEGLDSLLQFFVSGEPVAVTVVWDEVSMELLGITIPLGRAKRVMPSVLLRDPPESLQAIAAELPDGAKIEVHLSPGESNEVIDEYENWLPESSSGEESEGLS